MTSTLSAELRQSGVRFVYLIATLIALGAAIWAAASSTPPWWYLRRAMWLGWWPASWNQPVAGHWTTRFEVSSFIPCPGLSAGVAPREPWWTDLASQRQLVVERVWHGSRPRSDTTVFVAWFADISPAGAYGHMGQYNRAIAVREVIVVRPATAAGCSIAVADKQLFAEE